jgi:hypothetical protein
VGLIISIGTREWAYRSRNQRDLRLSCIVKPPAHADEAYLQSGGNAMLSRCVVMTLAAIICSAISAHAEDIANGAAAAEAPYMPLRSPFGPPPRAP